MNPEKIRFNCPACGIQLDVPASLAGVTGPCPSCQNSITAPHPQAPSPVAAPAPAPAPQQPVQAPQQPVQPPAQPSPPPVQQVAQPPQQEIAPAPQQPEQYRPQEPAPVYHEPLAPVTPTSPVQSPPPEAGPPPGENVFPTVVPSPTQPEVHPIPDEEPFPMEPSPMKAIPVATANQSAAPAKQSSRIPSILFLIATLILMTIAVLAILSYTGVVGLNNWKSLLGIGKSQPTEQITPSTAPTSPAGNASLATPSPTLTEESLPQETLSPPSSISTAPSADEPEPIPELEKEVTPEPQLPEGENFREGQTPLPEGFSNNPGDVQKILASFLSAKDLKQRLPFLSTESATSEKLAQSPLAGTLPAPTSTVFTDHLTDELEQRSDFFYVVAWDGQNNTPAKPIAVELHKWPGSEAPRVNSEAFLEFYEQKLDRFAASPLDRPARFFVLGHCVPKCFETDKVPDHASKATLNLASWPKDTNPIKAYFNKKGEMLEKLKAHRKGLAFRDAIPMTVTLAWSDPVPGSLARYLEVRLIDSFDWHP